MKKYYAAFLILCMCILSNGIAEELISAETYASYYGEAFNGKPTSSGEIFDMNLYTAAHKTLPFGTLLEVTNLENGKKVVVRVNDRGPFVPNREIDLSKAAAAALDMLNKGIARVSIKKLDSFNTAPKPAITQTNKSENIPVQQSSNKTATLAPSNNSTAYKQQPEPINRAPQAYEENQDEYTQSTESRSYNATANNTPERRSVFSSEPNNYQKRTHDYRASEKTTSYPSSPANTTVKTNQSVRVLWRIQLGSFVREENALRLVVALRKIGLEPAYERTSSHIRVVLPGIRTADLEYVKNILKEGGFYDYVIRQERW